MQRCSTQLHCAVGLDVSSVVHVGAESGIVAVSAVEGRVWLCMTVQWCQAKPYVSVNMGQ